VRRVLLHQVHPVKLGADITAAVVSTALLWRGRTTAGLAVRWGLAVAGSAAVLAFADVEALAGTRRGRYVLAHMPPAAQAVRLAGDTVLTMGARRRSVALLVAGGLVVLAGWSHGLLPDRR
jgi:hypothetical protein